MSRDARWSLALFLCGAAVSGFLYFVSPAPDARQGTSMTPGEFVPSLFLVAGRGFVEPVDYGTPELAPFMQRQQDRFDPATIPDDLEVAAPHAWDQRHRYLYYAGALVWMIFGVSWTALKLIPVLLYASMWPLLFRIFRLAGSRAPAAAFTAWFMLQPGIIELHWTIRDFSKAPFFLAVVLIIGLLLQRRVSPRRLVAYAVLAGVIAGIGVGFRRDLVMAMLPAVVAVFAAPRVNALHPWRIKPIAAAAMIGAFALAGAPIHAAYTGLGDPHDAVMGFSRLVDRGLGVKQADYQHLPIQSDFLVHAKLHHAARTVDGEILAPQLRPEEISGQGLVLVRWLTLTYPADMLTRTIASMRWALSGGMPMEGLGIVFAMLFGVIWPAGVLFLVASNDFRRGLALLAVCAPLFAYLSLQFGYRHGFHLTFAPLWCTLFYWTQWRRYRRYRRLEGRAGVPAWLRPGGQLRGWAILALVAGAMLVPLAVARGVQHRQVDALVAQYLSAEREELPVTARGIGAEWTLFGVDPNAPEPDIPVTRMDWPFREAYLVVAFAAGSEPVKGLIKYETENHAVDFSAAFSLPPSPDGGEPVLYFFPVYENWHIPRGEWNRFAGVAVPNAVADRFLGLYRLTEPTQFPFWSLYRIQGDGEGFNYARRLAILRPDPLEHIEPFVELPSWLRAVNRSTDAHAGQYPVEHALPAVQAGLEADPADPSLWLWKGNIREGMGELDAAEEAYRQAVSLVPRHFVGYRHLEGFMTAHRSVEAREALWAVMTEDHPDVHYPLVALARTLRDAERWDEALACAERAILIAPGRDDAFTLAREVMVKAATPSPATLRFWEEVTQARPQSALAWQFLGSQLLGRERDPARAAEAFRQSLALDAESLTVRMQYAHTLAAIGENEEAAAQLKDFLERGGDPGSGHLALASLYHAQGAMDDARRHARRAVQGGARLPQSLQALLE